MRRRATVAFGANSVAKYDAHRCSPTLRRRQGMILYSFSMCFMVFLVTGLVAFSIKVKNAGLEPGCGLHRGPISSTSAEDATLTWRWEKPTEKVRQTRKPPRPSPKSTRRSKTTLATKATLLTASSSRTQPWTPTQSNIYASTSANLTVTAPPVPGATSTTRYDARNKTAISSSSANVSTTNDTTSSMTTASHSVVPVTAETFPLPSNATDAATTAVTPAGVSATQTNWTEVTLTDENITDAKSNRLPPQESVSANDKELSSTDAATAPITPAGVGVTQAISTEVMPTDASSTDVVASSTTVVSTEPETTEGTPAAVKSAESNPTEMSST
ncbi:unnamed protein product [Ixodes persulcatus]